MEGMLTWVLEAQEKSHLVQVVTQSMLDHMTTALDQVVVWSLGR